jgi:hypothetical protein
MACCFDIAKSFNFIVINIYDFQSLQNESFCDILDRIYLKICFLSYHIGRKGS